MKKLLCALCLTVLLSTSVWAEYADTVEVEELSKTGLSWDGKALPNYPAGDPEITILRISVPPGVKLPRHRHTVINAGVLIDGELTVVTEEGKKLHIKAGESIVEVVNTWHYGKNEGDKPAEIIVFYAGVKDMPIIVK